MKHSFISSAASRWLWPIVIALLAGLLVIWVFSPMADAPPVPKSEQTPNAEWTTAPAGPAVKVDLPDTPMRNVPAEDGTPASSEASGE